MGSSIAFVYAVNQRELMAVPGSRRGEIVDVIANDYWQLDNVAQSLDDDIPIDLPRAVAQIVNGDELDPNLGSLYLFAVEALCWYLGSTLVLPAGFCGDEQIDEFLAARNCPFQIGDLAFSGSPIPIPEPDCPPSIGWWNPETVAAAALQIDVIHWDGADSETADGLTEVMRWLAEARKFQDGCLIATYY